MKWIAIPLVALIAAGCRTPAPPHQQVSSKIWTSSELNANKVEKDGVVVLLSAYLVHEPEAYSLWDSERASEIGDPKACVSLLYPKELKESIVRSNRKQVLLKGRFVRDVTSSGGVFLGLCNYTGLHVTEVIP